MLTPSPTLSSLNKITKYSSPAPGVCLCKHSGPERRPWRHQSLTKGREVNSHIARASATVMNDECSKTSDAVFCSIIEQLASSATGRATTLTTKQTAGHAALPSKKKQRDTPRCLAGQAVGCVVLFPKFMMFIVLMMLVLLLPLLLWQQ